MKYHGNDLIEITPEQWNGKPRKMLVWDDTSRKPLERVVVGYYPHEQDNCWMAIGPYSDGCSWQHCAEIPKEAQYTKHSVNNCIDTIESIIDCCSSADWQYLYRDVITYLESLTELKEENEKLKAECIARRKSEEEFKWERDQYRAERDEFANLLGKKRDVDIEGECKEEPTSETTEIKDAIVKKTRRMTIRELAEWLAKGNGQLKEGDFGSIKTELIYYGLDENAPVDNNCLIRGWNEDTWHEPMIEE